MVRARWQAAALVALAALGAAACSDDTSTSTTNPTPTTITDTFTGTLTPNGAATYQITALQSGQVTAILSALTVPDSDTPPLVGLSLGTWNGTSCHTVIFKDDATPLSQILGSVSAQGTLCVRIYDVGKVTTPASYTISVNHP
jgi:hypothetical protein